MGQANDNKSQRIKTMTEFDAWWRIHEVSYMAQYMSDASDAWAVRMAKHAARDAWFKSAGVAMPHSGDSAQGGAK